MTRPRLAIVASHLILFGLLAAGCSQDPGTPGRGLDVAGPQLAKIQPSHENNEPTTPPPDEDPQPTVPQWAVRLNRNVDPTDLANELGVVLLRHDPVTGITLYAGEIVLDDLGSDPRVSTAEVNRDIALSSPVEVTLGFHQGDLGPNGQPSQDGLQSLGLAGVHVRTKGAGIRVAVLDTGADLDHAMLSHRLQVAGGQNPPLPATEMGNNLDDDEDGEIDEAFGHGTHIAGIIATVAPEATIIPIRVLDDEGWGTVFDLTLGMYMAMQADADIVNLSLVLSQFSPMVASTIGELQAAGIKVIAAAGNDPQAIYYPATDPRTLAVAAVDAQDILAPFSSWGSEDVQVAAPGVEILSAYPGGKAAVGTGTSMSTGVASGTMALLLAIEHDTGFASQVLCATSALMNPGEAVLHGRVSPVGALKRLLRDSPLDIHATP